jgi:hypothetical protein
MVEGGWEVVGDRDRYGGEEGLKIWKLEGCNCCGIECEEVGGAAHDECRVILFESGRIVLFRDVSLVWLRRWRVLQEMVFDSR